MSYAGGMAIFHKILVPTDFTPPADEAVRIAVGLSRVCGAPLTILVVFQPPTVPLPEGALFARPEAMAKHFDHLKTQLDAVAARATDAGAIGVTPIITPGAAVDEIIAQARDGQFDLIVMGTHGRGGIRHALFGSIAEKVVQKASCAVLAVHEPG